MKRLGGKTVAIVAACGLIATLAVSGATAGTAKKSAGIQVCGLMPDTKTSVRWQLFDQPALEKAFKAAGVPARVVNAQGDPQKQKTQADQCIADGESGGGLKRSLGAIQLTALGVGAIIGAGIFVAIGSAISGEAGRPGAGAASLISIPVPRLPPAPAALT